MNVTITTDASYSKKHNRGTYAFFITSNLGRTSQSGVLRKKCSTPSEAELKCIINSLVFLSKQKDLFDKCKNIYINTDSLNCIHIWNNDNQSIYKYKLRPLQHLMKKPMKDIKRMFKDKSIELRHIKAHVSTDTKREWVNDFCDKAAKTEMGILIDKLEK